MNSSASPHEVRETLRDFTADRRMLMLCAMALVTGTFGAIAAWALVKLIALFTNLAYFQVISTTTTYLTHAHLGPSSILIPVFGGIIVGLIARYGSRKIRGHGIPEALESILIGGSRIEPAVAFWKPLSSAIAIGTGGPFGAEGPIIMTGGALGSLFGQCFRLSSAERKTLLAAGAAAGMTGIFGTPVAAILLAIEVMLFEWKPRSFVPVAVSVSVATAWRPWLVGPWPLFPHAGLATMPWWGLALCAAVGLIAGLQSALTTAALYWFEDLYEGLPIHWMWWPALGGLIVGIGGLIDPAALGVGYDTIDALINGTVLMHAAIALLCVKSIIWLASLSSGTAGGTLAPLLLMGGAVGAIESHILPFGSSGFWALISMAAVLGGTLRCPLTAILFAVELTGDLRVMPAVAIACAASFAVTVLLMRRSILTEKIARRGHHIAREYSVDALERLRVRDVMDANPATVPASMLVADLAGGIARGDPALTHHHALPITDEDGSLAGIITRSDILRSLDAAAGRTVLEAGSRELIVAYADETLGSATARMLRRNVGRLPVVNRDAPQQLVGYLGRPNILAARLRELDEEQLREASWPSRPGRQ